MARAPEQKPEFFDYWFDLPWRATRRGGEPRVRPGPSPCGGKSDGALVGASRYLDARRPDRVVEIGWTWFNPSVWRTGVNVETKLLMLTRAFEMLGCVRVELKTDARNERSRGAMALPAPFEGIMRKHMIVPHGRPARQRLLQRHRRRVAHRSRRPRSPPHLALTGRKLAV